MTGSANQSSCPGAESWIASSLALLAMTRKAGPGACPRQRTGHSSPGQPIREITDRLAIDRRPIPLAHRFEIRGALAVGRAVLEAGDVQQVGGRGQHIRHAVAQVDM